MPKTELEKLPPATQEGKQTFGCLLNGKAWVPKTSIDAVGVFQSGILQISGEINSPVQNIGIVLHESGVGGSIGESDYPLTNVPSSYVRVLIQLTETTACFYEPENTFEGSVTIAKLDRTNYIVSGFFEFSTVVSGCDTLKITNGRFDLKYIP